MRRAAFLATLAAGFGLVGVSIHGITSVDTQLKLAAERNAPAVTEPVLDRHDCHHHHQHRGGDV
jgi:hypothetical protein